MDNSSADPLLSECASNEVMFLKIEGCNIERCDIKEVSDGDFGGTCHDQYYLEMFRSALKEGNQDAQRWLEHHFRAMLIDWIHAHPSRDQACQLHPEEFYVMQAFKRCWQTSIPHQGFECKSVADVLHYLQVCLNAAILDELRSYSRSGIAQLEKSFEVSGSFSNDDNGSREVWRSIKEKLPDARKRRLAFLLFHCALGPVEIVRRCPQDFSDVQEVSRMRRDIMELLSQ